MAEDLKKAAEKTRVLYGSDNILQDTIEKISEIRSTIDSCIDATAPQTIVRKDLPTYRVFHDAKNRGVKLRYITEITEENISYCKELMKFAEVRHLDGIKGNFGIGDKKDFRAGTSVFEGQPPTELIVSTVRFFVEQQQYFFDLLWKKAIPAKQRIKEIEEGSKREFVETLREPTEIQELFLSLVKSAKKEILLLFSTPNSFHRVEHLGLLSLLKEVVSQYSVNIRVLMVVDNIIHEIIKDKFNSQSGKQINFQFISKSTQPKITVLIVDMEYSLIIDTNDDSKETFNEATGLSTYSNNESTVAAYSSIFESLWQQTELFEKLKEMDLIKTEFINVAAHELRTPIQPILGLSQVLRSKSEEPEYNKLLDIVIRNAKKMQRLTETILDVAKIETRLLDLKKESFDLNEVIQNTILDCNDQIAKDNRDNDLKLQLTESKEGIIIEADKDRINQVISNLIDNAIKFTSEGSISITTDKREPNNDVLVSVKDTGSGLDPEILPHLFSKFATKSDKGTGLGLFISKSIIEAHGGQIWGANNPDGKGAVFTFSLPIKDKTRRG